MPSPINSAPAAILPSPPNRANTADRPLLARQFTGATAAPLSGSVPFSRAAPRPSQSALAGARLPESPHRKSPALPISATASALSEQQKMEYKTFCTALGTNAGCQNIVEIMQGKRSMLDIGKIMTELGKRHGEETIQSLKKTGTDLKNTMKLITKERLQDIANTIYKAADPSKLSPNRVYRGQGMTAKGINTLLALKKSDTPVTPEYFLSCDKNSETAQSFADTYTREGEKKIQFQIHGFSNKALRSHLPYLGETETLFTPHATFKIENIFKGKNTGHIIVRLTEIPPDPKAVPLPY